ncbi:4142_t:CDS:1, partial [Dentiscutata heterogama]
VDLVVSAEERVGVFVEETSSVVSVSGANAKLWAILGVGGRSCI